MMGRLMVAWAALVLASCAGYSVTGGPGRIVNPPLLIDSPRPSLLQRVNTIFIAPLHLDPSIQALRDLEYPFHDELTEIIARETNVDLVPLEVVRKNFSPTTSEELYVKRALDGGRASRADAVLVTRVHRYDERRGGRVGADRGASVHFTTELLRVSDGERLWQASYRFEDQPLSENLFRVEKHLDPKRERGWSEARDIFTRGLSEAARRLAATRSAEFVG